MRKIISQTRVESLGINLALQNVDIEKVLHRKLACRVVARCVHIDKAKEVRLRRGYGATAPKAFGAGGKGIRTPDFQLAKLALYQLSYAPK